MNDFLTQFGLDKHSFAEALQGFVPNVAAAVLVVLCSIFFYIITARAIEAAFGRTHMQPSLIRIVVRSLYRGLIIILTLILMLSQLGINVTAALAGVGVLGLAAGFAAQQTLANIFSGFGIFIDHLYQIGDWVVINGYDGEVVSITLRTTKIKTLDNTYVSVPNSLVTSSPIINYTEKGMVRITAKVSIPYGESVDKARGALIAAVAKIEAARKDPAPDVVVESLADSGVNLLVRIWIDNARTEQKNTFILREVCKQALDDASIVIPFPQRDIHVVSGGVSRITRH
jgi:small conductance mechanosensitive channel